MKLSPALHRFAVCLPVFVLWNGGGMLTKAHAGGVQTVVSSLPADKDGDDGSDSASSALTAPTAGGTDGTSTDSIAYSPGDMDGGATLTLGGDSNITISSPIIAAGATATNLGRTLTLNGEPLVISGGNFITVTGVINGGTSVAKAPILTGKAGEVSVTPTANGGQLRIKASATVTNTGTKTAKNVGATVYLSDDDVLDSNDLQVASVSLATYFPETGGKIAKGQTLTLPIKHKVPASLADYVNGKYLIVVLKADGQIIETLNGVPVNQIVIGPIKLP